MKANVFRSAAVLTTILLGTVYPALGLVMERVGPLPNGEEAFEQPGWPKGIGRIIGHGSRVYSVSGNAADHYYFKATPEEIAEIVQVFSGLQIRDHEILIRKVAKEVKTFGGDKIDYNVRFHLYTWRALYELDNQGEARTYDPTLTIYVDPDDEENVAALKELVIEDHVLLDSEIEGFPESKVTRPARKRWFAQVQFKDGKPAVDFEASLKTKVTLWEKDSKEGFDLGEVNHKGIFVAAFSEEEIAKLKATDWWLTLTTGNYLVTPRGDDPLLPVENLGLDESKLAPLRIGKPALYYGKVLFEDGKPALLDPKPGQGQETFLSFPYAGKIDLDGNGYFKLFLTPQQLEALKARKPSKNVYLPVLDAVNTNRALYTFPVEKLSKDRETAGELRIPRPKKPKRLLPE